MKSYSKNFEIKNGAMLVTHADHGIRGKLIQKIEDKINSGVPGNCRDILWELHKEICITDSYTSKNNFFLVGLYPDTVDILGIASGFIEYAQTNPHAAQNSEMHIQEYKIGRPLHAYAFEEWKGVEKQLFSSQIDYLFTAEGVDEIAAEPEFAIDESLLQERGFAKNSRLWILKPELNLVV